jgi:tubulin polyglutamylase TTLL9
MSSEESELAVAAIRGGALKSGVVYGSGAANSSESSSDAEQRPTRVSGGFIDPLKRAGPVGGSKRLLIPRFRDAQQAPTAAGSYAPGSIGSGAGSNSSSGGGSSSSNSNSNNSSSINSSGNNNSSSTAPGASVLASAPSAAVTSGSNNSNAANGPSATSNSSIINNNSASVEPSVLRFKTGFRNTIYDVMLGRGWKLTESDMDWDFHWAERDWMFESFDQAHLESWQRVNHFRNDRELCRKDLLSKNVKRHRRALEKAKRADEAALFDFTPLTFVLPGEYALFVEQFKKCTPSTVWIMKPIGKSQGKGIFLFRNLSQISKWRSETRWSKDNPDVEQYVVQRYIDNPLLVGGKKFDMRIYALVTTYAPLTVYLYRGGFCRFSASKFSLDTTDIANNCVHLTNVAVQKVADNYNTDTGCKWDLRDLKLYLLSRLPQQQVDKAFRDIQDIVVRALMCVTNVMINDKHCFELYGYDIMFDDALKPWLLEVNASPSLSANTPEDYAMKYSMLNDVLDIVDMERTQPEDNKATGGFDLIYKGQEVQGKPSIYSTMLGTEVPLNAYRPPPRGSRRK